MGTLKVWSGREPGLLLPSGLTRLPAWDGEAIEPVWPHDVHGLAGVVELSAVRTRQNRHVRHELDRRTANEALGRSESACRTTGQSKHVQRRAVRNFVSGARLVNGSNRCTFVEVVHNDVAAAQDALVCPGVHLNSGAP